MLYVLCVYVLLLYVCMYIHVCVCVIGSLTFAGGDCLAGRAGHAVEGDGRCANLAMDDDDAVSGGFPGHVQHGLRELDLLHGDAVVAHPEEHEHVALLLRLQLHHVHTQVVPFILPHLRERVL